MGSTNIKDSPTSSKPATAIQRRQSTGSLQAPVLSSLPVHTLRLKMSALHALEINKVGSVPFSTSKSSIELMRETPSSKVSLGAGLNGMPKTAHSSKSVVAASAALV